MIDTLKKWVQESSNIVFFGGAGVSTESGIPDFRSVDGIYRQKYAYPPEKILGIDFFLANPEEYYRFYRDKILITNVEPNPAHLKLAQWEREGRLSAVITQNIDGLHQKAGSKRVYELHGSIHRNHCMRCKKTYTAERLLETSGVPRCSCGGIIRPDIVHYGESLDMDVLAAARSAIARADMMIIGGTSLVVYPAAALVDIFHGKRLVLVNKSATSRDTDADLIIREPIGQVFSQL